MNKVAEFSFVDIYSWYQADDFREYDIFPVIILLAPTVFAKTETFRGKKILSG